jgi:hypothetical protein
VGKRGGEGRPTDHERSYFCHPPYEQNYWRRPRESISFSLSLPSFLVVAFIQRTLPHRSEDTHVCGYRRPLSRTYPLTLFYVYCCYYHCSQSPSQATDSWAWP